MLSHQQQDLLYLNPTYTLVDMCSAISLCDTACHKNKIQNHKGGK